MPLVRAQPEPWAEPRISKDTRGGAEPRLTSGGEVASDLISGVAADLLNKVAPDLLMLMSWRRYPC
jgi:hypothetical protein